MTAMSSNISISLGQIAGVAGVACGIMILVFRKLIQNTFLAKLSKERSFTAIVFVVVLSWAIGIFGIATWAIAPAPGKCNPNIDRNSGTIEQTFNCD